MKLSKEDEIVLIKRANKGDRDAFGELWEAYAEKLERYIKLSVPGRLAFDPDIAGDILQDTWVKIMAMSNSIPEMGFGDFLFKLARETMKNHLRDMDRRYDKEALPENLEDYTETPSTDPDPLTRLVEKETALVTEKLLKKLDQELLKQFFEPRIQTIFHLQEIHNLSQREISSIIGISEAEVSKRRYMMIRALKKLFGRYGITRENMETFPDSILRLISHRQSSPLESSVRYADFKFYYEQWEPLKEVPANHALRSRQWYLLEIAVRTNPIGISSEKTKRKPLREFEKTKDIEIMVALECEGFEITESIQKLILPPHGDSIKNAMFQVRPLRSSTSKGDLSTIRVRLYYQFNLIEVALISAVIVSDYVNLALS